MIGFQGVSPVPGGVAGHLVEPAEHWRSPTTLLSGDVTTVCNTLFIYQYQEPFKYNTMQK